ncbi:MAG: winged helix-turn-helix transcriptional regulator [Sulfolobales archaeon]|nr:winged helix-turn-helix transcriptional regulator [Sulfolobales archaeon]MCX8185730.1 winged helix-turn-helix transcriptional regulator [Sulfolobales archaeon]MDW7970062.1 winged helix-turn-helix transcriptional regulator [Sulfolobales archaeon]
MTAEERVLDYLKTHPGATPREVADALGMSLTSVRIAINRLRELGQVVRGSRGGYLVRVGADVIFPHDHLSNTALHTREGNISQKINELLTKVSDLEVRVRKLEDDVKYIKKSIPKMPARHPSLNKNLDKLLSTVKSRGVITVNEALELTDKPLENYISREKVILIGDLLVHPEFLSSFKSKFPIKVSDINSLSDGELKLLEALIKTNQVYLFSGLEYRFLD